MSFIDVDSNTWFNQTIPQEHRIAYQATTSIFAVVKIVVCLVLFIATAVFQCKQSYPLASRGLSPYIALLCVIGVAISRVVGVFISQMVDNCLFAFISAPLLLIAYTAYIMQVIRFFLLRRIEQTKLALHKDEMVDVSLIEKTTFSAVTFNKMLMKGLYIGLAMIPFILIAIGLIYWYVIVVANAGVAIARKDPFLCNTVYSFSAIVLITGL